MIKLLSNSPVLSATCLAAALAAAPLSAGDAVLGSLRATGTVPVTVDNFVRAATEIEYGKYLDITGGVNRWFHAAQPTPIDNQPTIRMNRDTLYSGAVVDISEDATLTMPDPGERYMSVMVVNQDHYINEVFHGGGAFTLDTETFGTPYVILIVRTLVDSEDAQDVEAVRALQAQMTIEAASARPFIVPNYDKASFENVLNAALDLSRFIPDSFRTFGAKGDVDPVRHFLGTAFGWGGLPENEAFYLNVEPGLPAGEYRIEVPAEVPVDAFWSVSMYNAAGFFEPNELDAYSVNSVTGTRNEDGSVTVNLGGCDDGRVNCLPLPEGWNYAVRMYQPRPEVLNGDWTFPAPEPAG